MEILYFHVVRKKVKLSTFVKKNKKKLLKFQLLEIYWRFFYLKRVLLNLILWNYYELIYSKS
jgi:hypothetical protein